MTVSIITVTFNSAATLEGTIRSVLNQTYRDIEYILVDGSSTDATLDIIKRYEPLFQGRMRWISEPDRGLYDAMNKGILMATGQVVGTLNSDDFFSSNQVISRVAEEIGSFDAVFGDIHFVDPDNLAKTTRYYSSRIFRPWMLRFGFMPAHPSFYAKRSLFQRHGLYSLNYKIAADYDMMVRLFHVQKISYRYLPLDFVSMRPGGMSTRSLSHRLLTTREDVLACRTNGLYTNFLLVSFKYLKKLTEFRGVFKGS